MISKIDEISKIINVRAITKKKNMRVDNDENEDAITKLIMTETTNIMLFHLSLSFAILIPK
jgi:hypothetical protein